MSRHQPSIALVILLIVGASIPAGAQRTGHLSHAGPEPATAYGHPLIVTGRVQLVLAPQLFTVEDGDAHRELLVLVPGAEATPVVESTIEAQGVLRPFDEMVENTGGWNGIDARTRKSFAGRAVLVATSVTTSTGHQLVRRAAETSDVAASQPPHGEGARVATGDRFPLIVRPATLAGQIDALAGHSVRVPYARVVGLFNPRVFLIDTATRLPPAVGNRNRVLVLVDPGALRVPAALIVGSTVTVLGVARTLIGVQVTGEVAWPTELRREVLERLDVRAAILASSVQSAEGIELTNGPRGK